MHVKGATEFLLGAASEAAGRSNAHHYKAAGVPHQVLNNLVQFVQRYSLFSRLTEARARMELREEATQKDAEEVIMISKMIMILEMKILFMKNRQVVEIMRSSMIDTFSDDIGQLDFSRSTMG